MEFTVKRSEWLRGGGIGNYLIASRLLKDNGKKCCLGFLSLACGYVEDEIKNITYPSIVTRKRAKDYYPDKLVENQCVIASINDDDNSGLTDSKREEKLIKIFSDLGITVKFED